MPDPLDLFDMRLFTHIVEGNSFTHGAEFSHISLPAASTRIRNLEDSVGTKLFYRTRQGVTLTAAGDTFLRHARLMLNQLGHLRGDLQEYAQGVKGHVRVFATTTAISEFLPEVLGDYLPSWPNINVELIEHLGDDIVGGVREGLADLGIVADSVPVNGLHVVPYRRHRLVLVTPVAHPLGQLESVAFAETLEFDYVGLPAASSFQIFLVKAAAALNKRLNVRVRVRSFEAVCRMIARNVGIGLLPESAARRLSETLNIHLLRLEDDWASRRLLICARSVEALPTYARGLVDLLEADEVESSRAFAMRQRGIVARREVFV